MKNYLITGGAGFIGRSLVKELLNKARVRVLDNNFRGVKDLLPKSNSLEFIEGDIRDIQVVQKACSHIDSIIHLAFINGTKYFYEKPDLVLDVGVRGMLSVLDAAKQERVSELFLASSSEVYQNPPIIPTPEDVPYSIPTLHNPRFSYAGGKIISELLSYYIGKTFLKKIVIFRPHNIYGPGMGNEHVIPELIGKIIADLNEEVILPIQGTGRETRAFLYIDDFISAMKILLAKGVNKEVYNIGTDQEVTIRQIVKTLSQIANKKITMKPSPAPEGSVSRRCPDIQKLKMLGFIPKTSLEEGLEKTYLWYDTHGKK